MKDLNKWLKEVRLSNDLTSTEMSDKLGISLGKYSKMEVGEQKVDGETLLKFIEIFNLYNAEQRVPSSIPTISTQQTEVNKVLESIKAFMNDFTTSKELPFSGNPLKTLLVDQLPAHMKKAFNLSTDIFKITGSIGKGQFAEVCWLCVFLQDITKTATKGYYIVFLFSSDASKVYMSLNQGWTFYQEKYGTKLARTKIQIAATELVNELSPLDNSWIKGPLDLNVRGTLAKGYEIGNIYAREYTLNDFPTPEQFVSDFEQLLNLYSEINVLKGLRTVDDFTETLLLVEDKEFFEEENEFNDTVQQVLAEALDEKNQSVPTNEPTLARNPISTKSGKPKYTRRAYVAAEALKKANFQCEIDNSHITFTNKATNTPYVEAHHLIHMSAQGSFEYELDCINNIVALCPTCHRLLHHGTDSEKEQQLELLHTKRADQLADSKIYLPLIELKKMYKISE